jgi:hypothetical protein
MTTGCLFDKAGAINTKLIRFMDDLQGCQDLSGKVRKYNAIAQDYTVMDMLHWYTGSV